ncbi:MAG: hypothetical protein IT281_02025 [Ignavibacteria bacterium]|nr:hypothetical protein [Ignavibacteria bacterium]MCC7158297.1 hypothetical protein [Ignavibacteria bacterium]
MKALLILLLFLASFSLLSADELPIGKKYIVHETEIVNKDVFSDYIFLAAFKDYNEGTMYESCRIYDNSASCGSSVFAVRKSDYDSNAINISGVSDYTEQCRKIDSYIRGNKNYVKLFDVDCSNTANNNTPYDKVIEKYEIESINHDDGKALLKKIKTVYLDGQDRIIDEKKGLNQQLEDSNKSGYIYYSLPILSLVFILTFVVLRKRKL